MSGYERPQEAYAFSYTSTRPGQEQTYAGSTQATFNPPFPSTQVDESHAILPTHQMPYLGQPFEPRDTAYQASPTAFIDARTRTSPEITSTSLQTGKTGEKFRLSIRSKVDYSAGSYQFVVIFGTTPAPAICTRSLIRDSLYYYTVECSVPPLTNAAQTQQLTMPLLLDVRDDSGQSVTMKSLDSFTYLDSSPYQQYAAPVESHKKRKYAEERSDYAQPVAKRSASTPIQPRGQVTYGASSDGSPFTFDHNGLYGLPTTYERPSQGRQYQLETVQRPSYPFSASPSMPSSSKVRSPSLSSYGPYGPLAHPSPSPQMSAVMPTSQSPPQRSVTSAVNPPLIRTSILQPQAASSFRAPGFNPYTIYPSAKARLDIQGDLQDMARFRDWTDEEKKAKRRLVEFHRVQEDSCIHATFKPVAVEERTQGTHCVSCIYWESRGECFVTSVDTIQLLEGLVGVRFTVEEKNRIRRNLEGYKPLTVSKQKEDSESFFRLIMGFPNPKPRNIEKDVKVFRWSVLGTALKKIISKYSASYSSTSAILATSSSTAFGPLVSEVGIEHRPTASPQSTTSSAASHGYPSVMTSTALSGSIGGKPALEVAPTLYDGLRQTSQSMTPLGHWASQYPPVSGLTQYQTGHGPHHPGRASWDAGQYGGQHLPSAPTHHLHYYAGNNQTGSVQPNDYPTHSQAHG